METKLDFSSVFTKCFSPIPDSDMKAIANPFVNMDLYRFLSSRGYTFHQNEDYSFYYINHANKIKIKYLPVNGMIEVYGWYDGDDDRIEGWAHTFRFTDPGTLEGFKSIMKAYTLSL